MLRSFLLFFFCLISPSAYSQSVRYESSSGGGIERKPYRVAAEEQGRKDWPSKGLTESAPGTQIRATFDYKNADLTFVPGKDYPNAKLLKTLQGVFPALGYPNADYIVTEHEFAPDVDVELNDYLVHPKSNVTTFSLDLAALARALEKTDLPRPIVLGIKPKHSRLNTVTLNGKPISDITFLGVSEIHSPQTLDWRAELHWSGWVALVLFATIMVFGIVTPWWTMLRKKKPDPVPEAIPDPAEVQKAYDKSRPMWLMMAPAVVLPTLLFATGGATRAMESATLLVPRNSSVGMMAAPLSMFVSMGLATLAGRLRDRKTPTAPEPPDPDAPPRWTQMGFFYALIPVLGLMMIAVALLPSWNPLRSLPLSLRKSAGTWLPLTTVVIGFAPAIIVSILASRKVRTTLKPGDEWFERTQEIARKANVRVRNVVVIQSVDRNAYASLFGTVGLTSKLLREFTTEEVTAIVAHEVGHHRGGHVKRTFWISLAVTVVLLGGWWALTAYWEKRLPRTDERRALLNSPLFAIFVLPLLRSLIVGKGRREREFAADRFAVEVLGDPELVIATLEKLHARSGLPQRLKPSDQALSSHPDLAKRIERIRQDWATSA